MRDARSGQAVDAARPSQRAADRRRERVDAGVAELLIWLEDQVSTGLARLRPEAYRRFDAMGARLVDAQAPGLAARVRALAGVTASGPGWNERLLAELALLHALSRAHQRLADLPDDLAVTVRSHVGYPTRKASVLEGPAVSDAWYVIGRRDEADGVLTTRRTWLIGGRTGCPALVLSFAARGERLDDSLVVGTVVLADLHFYPGSLPLRALVGAVHGVLGAGGADPSDDPRTQGPPPPPPAMTVTQARRRWSACLARDPWVRRTAVVVSVAPVMAPGNPDAGADRSAPEPVRWRDAAGEELVEAPRPAGRTDSGRAATGWVEPPEPCWAALAVGGGAPVPLCAELADDGLTPLAVWTSGGAVPAPPARERA